MLCFAFGDPALRGRVLRTLITETDIRVVRQVAVLQEQHIQQLTKKLAEAHAKLAELTGQNDLQADLALVEALANAVEQPAERPAESKPKDKPQRGHGATEQPNLPQEELICSLPETEQACPKCGEKLKPAPGMAERSELIDVVEVKYVLRKVVREAAVCRCGECVVVAPGPERVTAGGRYSLDFGIKIALDKYLDHLPLARQTRISFAPFGSDSPQERRALRAARHGLNVTDQVLWDQIRCLGEELLPTWKAVRAHILEGPVIGVDQTPWLCFAFGDPHWGDACLRHPGREREEALADVVAHERSGRLAWDS